MSTAVDDVNMKDASGDKEKTVEKARKKELIGAIDCERSGGRSKDDTIGWGGSVVGEDGEELDSFFVPGFFPGRTVFEKKCKEEFWDKFPEQLEALRVTGPMAGQPDGDDEHLRETWEKHVYLVMVAFFRKWELYAKENGFQFILASDNKVFDGGFFNEMVAKFDPERLPLPYSFGDNQKYKAFLETNSEMRGFLMGIGAEVARRRGESYGDVIARYYDTSSVKCVHNHTHNPAEDAYSIARDAQVMRGIGAGRIKLRKEMAHEVVQFMTGGSVSSPAKAAKKRSIEHLRESAASAVKHGTTLTHEEAEAIGFK